MKLNPRAPVFKPRKCPYNLRSKGPPSPPPPSPRSLTPANSIISIKNEPGSSPKSDNGRMSAYSPPLTDEIEGSETFLVPPMNQDLYSPPPTTPSLLVRKCAFSGSLQHCCNSNNGINKCNSHINPLL